MTLFFRIHPQSPQTRLINQASEIIQSGGLAILPTDACYALACSLDNKSTTGRLRRLRDLNEKHHFTILCRNLSEISYYAKLDNRKFRFLKMATPGPFTFILEASREVPKRLSHPSKKTLGLRVPSNPILHSLLEHLDEPLISTSLIFPGDEYPLTDPDDIHHRLNKQVDLIIDGGAGNNTPTTIIDFTEDEPKLVRQGLGKVDMLGL